jgi:hypothetical protein
MISWDMVELESSWFGSWYAVGAMHVCKVLGYMWDACERGSILTICVTLVSLWPLVTGNNLGAWSCLDVV